MAIIGIRRLTWLVEDMDACVRFFTDFGLTLIEMKADEALFEAGHPQKPLAFGAMI
ncbi:MAG: hypothetical protein N2Z59_08985 [Alteraurantiacibacter sp.]|nr:hypothetical protein [Alteraurantiacibacter sp.]